MILIIIFLEKEYLEAIKDIRVYEILLSTENKEIAEEFLKHILVSAAKYDKKILVSEICSLLIDEHNSNKRDLKTRINAILHYKDQESHSAIYYANYNNQLLTGIDLLYVEKEVHSENRDGALKCLRKNAGYIKLDQWLIGSYKIVHPPGKVSRYASASLVVGLQLLLSFIFLF